MMIFWITASALLCFAAALLLHPLLRQRKQSPTAGSGNIDILREQFEQINQDLAAGSISSEQHDLAVKELEQRVLEENSTETPSGPMATASSGRPTRTAWVVGLLIPVLSLTIYAQLGHYKALGPLPEKDSLATEDLDLDKLRGLVEKLAQRMAQEPHNLEGWTHLARAYVMLKEFTLAQKAYKHALSISPPDPHLLADLADALAMGQGQSVLGEPEPFIERALQIDPHHVKSLVLAGGVAFEKQNFSQAIEFWTKALKQSTPESEVAKALESSLAIARAELHTHSSSPMPDDAPAQLTGTVRLSSALLKQVNPDDTVFIFARASEGPRMPLAILRASVKDLPLRFTLDDSHAMSPQTRLSQFKTVIVGARISKSGQATLESGDLIGQTSPVSHRTQGLDVLIHEAQP